MRSSTLFLPLFLLAGCSTGGDQRTVASGNFYAGSPLTVCSGFGCKYEEQYSPAPVDIKKLRAIMQSGSRSPAAERKAIRRAVAFMETQSLRRLGFAADAPLSYQKHLGIRGQMDCYDESLNTRTYLRLLARHGLLSHHAVLSRIGQRGYLIDGRYPHKAALMKDTSGSIWAVDSWRGRNGQPPEIMTFRRWKASDRRDFAYDSQI